MTNWFSNEKSPSGQEEEEAPGVGFWKRLDNSFCGSIKGWYSGWVWMKLRTV